MILLLAALSLAALIVGTLNLSLFPVKAVSVLPVATCIIRNGLFVCPVNWFPAFTGIVSLPMDHLVDVIQNIFARAEHILDVFKVVRKNSLEDVVIMHKNILQ